MQAHLAQGQQRYYNVYQDNKGRQAVCDVIIGRILHHLESRVSLEL